MKFSIVSLMMLTLWIALTIQIGFSRSRVLECSQQKAALEQESKGFVSKYRGKAREYDQKVPLLENELRQIATLYQELGKAFEAALPALSVITPQENAISIRRIPIFAETLGEQKLKIHIPPSRKLSLRVELQSTGDDENLILAQVQWKPERSVLRALSPGTHLIQWKYGYQKDSSTFVAHVDAKEMVRFTWNAPQSGYSISGPALGQQQNDYPHGKSFRRQLYKIKPSSTETQVLISLFEPE